jgi:hypothetical protein
MAARRQPSLFPELDEDDDDDDASSPLAGSGKKGKLQDPTAQILRQVCSMLAEVRREKAELHKALLAPVATGVKLLTDMLENQTSRVRDLEKGWFDLFLEREELLSRKQERDLMQKQHDQAEARKSKVVDVLKEQIPDVIQAWGRQSDLATFLKNLPPEILDLIREHPTDSIREKVQALVPKPTTMNGHNS